MNHRGVLATGLIIGAVLASTSYGATLILTLTAPASGGGVYNSAGAGNSANLVPGTLTANPQLGGFVQIIYDKDKNGIGAALPGGNGLANPNPANDEVIGTFYLGQGGPFNADGNWGTITLDPIGLSQKRLHRHPHVGSGLA